MQSTKAFETLDKLFLQHLEHQSGLGTDSEIRDSGAASFACLLLASDVSQHVWEICLPRSSARAFANQGATSSLGQKEPGSRQGESLFWPSDGAYQSLPQRLQRFSRCVGEVLESLSESGWAWDQVPVGLHIDKATAEVCATLKIELKVGEDWELGPNFQQPPKGIQHQFEEILVSLDHACHVEHFEGDLLPKIARLQSLVGNKDLVLLRRLQECEGDAHRLLENSDVAMEIYERVLLAESAPNRRLVLELKKLSLSKAHCSQWKSLSSAFLGAALQSKLKNFQLRRELLCSEIVSDWRQHQENEVLRLRSLRLKKSNWQKLFESNWQTLSRLNFPNLAKKSPVLVHEFLAAFKGVFVQERPKDAEVQCALLLLTQSAQQSGAWGAAAEAIQLFLVSAQDDISETLWISLMDVVDEMARTGGSPEVLRNNCLLRVYFCFFIGGDKALLKEAVKRMNEQELMTKAVKGQRILASLFFDVSRGKYQKRSWKDLLDFIGTDSHHTMVSFVSFLGSELVGRLESIRSSLSSAVPVSVRVPAPASAYFLQSDRNWRDQIHLWEQDWVQESPQLRTQVHLCAQSLPQLKVAFQDSPWILSFLTEKADLKGDTEKDLEGSQGLGENDVRQTEPGSHPLSIYRQKPWTILAEELLNLLREDAEALTQEEWLRPMEEALRNARREQGERKVS